MSQMLTCPFCNHRMPLPRPFPPGRRQVCPRCAETFLIPSDFTEPVADETVATERPASPQAIAQQSADLRRQRESRARRSLVRAIIIMGSLLFAGVAVGLGIRLTRPAPAPTTTPEPVEVVDNNAPPALQSESFRWLPNEVNLVASIRPAAMVVPDSKESPLDWLPTELLTALQVATGRNPSTWRELTIAATIDEQAIPRTYLIAVSRQGFDREQLTQKAAATRTRNRRTLARYDLGRPGFELWVQTPTPYVLLATTRIEDFDNFPAEIPTRMTPAILTDELQLLAKERVAATPWAIVLADPTGWERLLPPRVLLGRMAPDMKIERLSEIKGVALSYSPETPAGWLGWLHMRNPNQGRDLRESIGASIRKIPDWPLTIGGADDWIMLRLSAEPKDFSDAIRRVRPAEPPSPAPLAPKK